MKTLVRQGEAKGNAELFRDAIPAIESGLNFPDVVVAQAGVQRRERGNFFLDDLSIDDFEHGIIVAAQLVVIFLAAFEVAAL